MSEYAQVLLIGFLMGLFTGLSWWATKWQWNKLREEQEDRGTAGRKTMGMDDWLGGGDDPEE